MWHINLVENTVKITKKCAQDLMKIEDKQSYSWDESVYEEEAWPTEDFGKGGYLFFDSDAYEHMDYVHEPDLQKVLLQHKVNGHIIFNSFDGDNKGQAWGYIFKDGVCTNVFGKVGTILFE